MVKPWRLHLANSAIQHVDIIAGSPALLAVWTRDGKVAYYDLEKGDAHGSSAFTLPEDRKNYWPFIAGLKDSKGRKLAHARVGMSFWPLENGDVLEYGNGATVELYKNDDESLPQTLVFDVKPVAIAVEPKKQLVAAIDSKGSLLLGQLGGTIKTVKPGLTPAVDLPLSVVIARDGKRIVVSDGAHLIVLDDGKVKHRRDLHYACGILAISPDGNTLLAFDADSGVLRAYDPDGLHVTHQRFVVDLLSSADELQLIGFAEMPPMSAALNALAVDNEGRFAFAVFGQVSAASIRHLASTTSPVGGKSAPAVKEPAVSESQPVEKSVGKADEKPAAKSALKNESASGGTQKSGAQKKSTPQPTVKKTAEEIDSTTKSD